MTGKRSLALPRFLDQPVSAALLERSGFGVMCGSSVASDDRELRGHLERTDALSMPVPANILHPDPAEVVGGLVDQIA